MSRIAPHLCLCLWLLIVFAAPGIAAPEELARPPAPAPAAPTEIPPEIEPNLAEGKALCEGGFMAPYKHEEEAREIFHNWCRENLARIRKNTRYPPLAIVARASGMVIVRMVVSVRARVSPCEMVRSSGSRSLDDYTVKAVCGTEYLPVPPELGVDELVIWVPMGYRYWD
ncbi:MAG: TonB family protein [Zavarzinia sp.]|nr:TonB family protein [Zavarzinia sp.]